MTWVSLRNLNTAYRVWWVLAGSRCRKEGGMQAISEQVKRFIKGEEAAAAVEYALLIGFIAVVIAGGVTLLGQSLIAPFTQAATGIS